MAVNLSARQLRDPTLLASVERALHDHDLPAERLCLELTETLLMEDPDAAAETLGALRALGVTLSIDDFGTGYSSLSYLKRFPVDHVKIDRAFVEGLDTSDGSEVGLVSAIIAMAGALHIGTVAEGVETEAQARRLRRLGCERAQGHLFARPLPLEEVAGVLRRLERHAAPVLAAMTDADVARG
jgi:EAL domain-containing protein (putative c-di-GMP-specific phosphodiesterase class I)